MDYAPGIYDLAATDETVIVTQDGSVYTLPTSSPHTFEIVKGWRDNGLERLGEIEQAWVNEHPNMERFEEGRLKSAY